MQYLKSNLFLVNGWYTSKWTIGIDNPSLFISAFNIIKDLFLLIAYFSFNIFSHSPNDITEIFLYSISFWLSVVVTWYIILPSFTIKSSLYSKILYKRLSRVPLIRDSSKFKYFSSISKNKSELLSL